MPTYRTTNAAGRSAHAAANARAPRSKAPIVVAAIVVVAALAVALAFAFGGNGAPDAANVDSHAEPMSNTAFSEALPAETVVAADNVVMTVAGDVDTYVLKGEEYLEAGCHAVDPDAGDITSSVETSGNVNTDALGDYEVTYTATTSDGAKAQAKRNVHVVNSLDAAEDVPVLMYHYVYTEDDAPAELNGNYILDTKLAEQCAYLRDNDYYFPSYQELRAWVDGDHTLPAKSVVLTFDDGEMGFLKYGIPVLEEYEVPATSFVVAKDAAQNVIDYASPFVQFESHSYNMHRAGGGNIGKGGVIHALDQQEIYDDIIASNEVTGGEGAVALAYPFGDNNETAWAALEDAGILCAFTVKNDRIHVGDNPMALSRVRLSGEYGLASFIDLVKPSA